MSEVDLKNFKKGPMVAVLLLGAFFSLLNETLLATALPSIMADFGITQNKVQWLTTAFLLTNGIMIPISAFLIERFTTRKLFLYAISVFAIGTTVAAFSHSFPLLLTARIIQATGSGIMLPLMMTVLLTIFPVEKRGAAMGMAGIVISFAPAIGPTLSGWLLNDYSWRSLFYVVVPIALLTLIGAVFFVKNVTKLTYPKIDVLSIILSSFGFGGLLYGFSSAGEEGWGSALVISCVIGGAIILTVFIIRQLRLKVPMLEFRVFNNSIFSISLIVTMIVLISLIGAETLLPLYMQITRGFTPLESGLMLLPGAIVMGIMSPITGILFDKVGAKVLAIPGLLIVSVTTYLFSDLTMETSFTFLTIVYAVRMLGLSLIMMPMMTNGLNQLPQKWNSHGTAMANTMQQVSASIGTAMLVTIVTIGSGRYEPDPAAIANLSQGEIQQQVTNQALISGYNLAFLAAAGLTVIGLILTLFLKGTPSRQEQKAGETAASAEERPVHS